MPILPPSSPEIAAAINARLRNTPISHPPSEGQRASARVVLPIVFANCITTFQ